MKRQLAVFERSDPADLKHTWLGAHHTALIDVITRVRTAAIWRLDRRPLPKPGTRADRIFGKLVRDFPSDDVLAAIARNLDAIVDAGPYEFERALGRRWFDIRTAAHVSAYLKLASRRSGAVALDILAPLLKLMRNDQRTMASLRRQLAKSLPAAFREPSFSLSPEVAEALIASLRANELSPDLVKELRRKLFEAPSPRGNEIYKVLDAMLDEEVAAHLLATSTLRDLLHHEMLARIARLQPDLAVQELAGAWQSPVLDELLAAIAPAIPASALTPLAPRFGQNAVERYDHRDLTPEAMAAEYARSVLHLDTAPESLELQTRLWHLLGKLERHTYGVERTGYEAKLHDFVAAHPEACALAMPELLERRSKNSIIDTVMLRAAIESSVVYDALHAASATDDAAYGLLRVVDGAVRPGASLGGALLDFVARHLDGAPSFPHPLELKSSTWMTNLGLEQILRSEIAASESRYRPYFEKHWSAIEETNTERLISEIEFGFRGVADRLQKLDAAGKSLEAFVNVSRREIMKSTEEPKFGCDLALLMHAQVHRALHMETAELVQVKKSEAAGGKQRNDAWKIDVAQLDALLRTSQSSSYWLISAPGEVYAVPAKVIRGMLNARERVGKTANVGYNDIRSAAIGLPQFFTDLLIGGWIGDMSEETLAIARGTSKTTRPQLVLEIEVRCGARG